MPAWNTKDLIGKRFGRLVVIERNGLVKRHHLLWKCKCDCGNEKNVSSTNLLREATKSCGCLRRELHIERAKKYIKHGHCRLSDNNGQGTPTYRSWHSMIDRCSKKYFGNYSNYGGRGITVCDEWKDFRNFLRDMGERPEGTTFDRINSNGNYEPSNCRWANCRIQAQNRRKEIYIKNLIYDNKNQFSIDIEKQNNIFI